MTHKYSIAACARWETRYIVEWLLYHKTIGFDHVFLYCNDDEPGELYTAVLPFVLGPDPFVTFHHVPMIGVQQLMYLHFLYNHKDETEWMCFLDIDEFLRLPKHNSVSDFVESFEGKPDSIYLNWCYFGNNGFEERPAGFVLTNYTRRSARYHSYMTKHLTRAAVIKPERIVLERKSHFWHYWNCLSDFRELKVVNVLGQDVHSYYDSPEASRSFFREDSFYEQILQTAVINHYAFKSRQDFLLRAERGTSSVFSGQTHYKELYETGRADQILKTLNEVEDLNLALLWDRFVGKIDRVTEVVYQPRRRLLSRYNVSHLKPAMQSSISEWSRNPSPQDDAAGAVNGCIDGSRKFHTSLENNPWWQVDLGGDAKIREVHVYNTVHETASRLKRFRLDVSLDGVVWTELLTKLDDSVVGGVNSLPAVWDGPETVHGRFVRVTLLGHNFLHLDQVEVFGEMINSQRTRTV